MSRRYLCVVCWRARPVEELYYTCPGCERQEGNLPFWARGTEPGKGRPISSLRRSWWRRRSFLEPAEVVCPRHSEVDLQLYCPSPCGAPITRAAQVGDRGGLGVGFAGATSAGKTIFTLAAIRKLRRARVDGYEVFLLGLGDTEERFGALESSLFGEHRRPEPTPETNSHGGMNFAWEVAVTQDGATRRGRDALVAVSDLAGETWGQPSHEPAELLDRYLELMGGVVFLLDGASVADDLGLESKDAWNREPRAGDQGTRDRQWLRWLIERLGARASEVDLALTISKGDLIWTHGDWAELKPPPNEGRLPSAEPRSARSDLLQRVLDASGRGDLPASARANFRRTGVFIASSLGFRPGPGDVDSSERLVRPLAPHNVEAPVLWLLAQRLRSL